MRKFLTVLLIGSATALAQIRLSVPYERFILPNGLNVILHIDRTVPTATVNMWYHVGSGYEKPGRTGFAHLFEHLMFEGSKNVAEGKFDEWLEAAGGNNNGSTNTDRTNYYEDIPNNAVNLALFLESDRMGFLLDDMTQQKLDGQRAVVKNERRQRIENAPYGMAFILLNDNLYPPNHPYHWPTIGSMADLNAAALEDVKDFFRLYYAPNNASLCISGDIDAAKTRATVEQWFADVPKGKPVPSQDRTMPSLSEERRMFFEDRVQLPRLYMAWHSPAAYAAGDAEMDLLANVLAGGKNSRLFKRLVYDLQIAQDVNAFQNSQRASSIFGITATARKGHTLAELEKIIQEEIDKVKSESPSVRELQRAKNQFEVQFLDQMESSGTKADRLNYYYYFTGNPDYFNEDLARYFAIEGDDIRSVAQTFLKDQARVILSVVPKGEQNLASGGTLVNTEGK